MKKIGIYITLLLTITIVVPSILVQVYKGTGKEINLTKDKKKEAKSTIQNVEFKKTQEISFEEYVLGVVASEMPMAFHEEALKAQSVAARTYAISRLEKFKDGQTRQKLQGNIKTLLHRCRDKR